MGIQESSVDLDDMSTPVEKFCDLLGDMLIDYSMLSNLEQIGEGGFATVHRAQLTHRNGMKQNVAVKKLRSERVQSDEDLKEFITVRRPYNSATPYSCSRALLHSDVLSALLVTTAARAHLVVCRRGMCGGSCRVRTSSS
ncbi:MAG: hypothetical protein HC767_01205 [Akkermansiaceae bacterium]|nr:hypothetical protein [Akkermansiaceae bacterium]